MFPSTDALVENLLVESIVSPKPVMAVLAMGLVPMSPVTLVTPVVVTPVLLKMAKSPAVPRLTPLVARRRVSSSGSPRRPAAAAEMSRTMSRVMEVMVDMIGI